MGAFPAKWWRYKTGRDSHSFSPSAFAAAFAPDHLALVPECEMALADASDSKKPRRNPPYITVEDDDPGYPLEHFCIPRHYAHDLDSVLIPKGFILDRVERLAQDISRDLPGPLVALCVLKGGYQFFSDLLNFIKSNNSFAGSQPVQIQVDFVRLKSYEDTQSSGEVRVVGIDNLEELQDKNVLIVEDIIDSGRTMQKLLSLLDKYKPKKVRVASLLVKRVDGKRNYTPDYVGFEVPNKFVVGYALDYNEYFRDLNHICILNDKGIYKYSQEQLAISPPPPVLADEDGED